MSKSSRGFSLVEVLVVMVIITITVAIASLSIPSRMSLDDTRDGPRLFRWIQDCAEEARLSGQVVGLIFLPNERSGTNVEVLSLNQRMGDWVAFQCFGELAIGLDSKLSDIELRVAGQSVELDRSKRADQLTAQLIFLPSGEILPFDLSLSNDGVTKISSNGFDELKAEFPDD